MSFHLVAPRWLGSPLGRYGLAVAVSLALLALARALEGPTQGVLLSIPIAAVAVLALALGPRPAALASALMGLAIWIFFLPPSGSLALASARDGARLVAYAVASATVVLAMARLQRTRGQLSAALAEQRQKDAELRQAHGAMRRAMDVLDEGEAVAILDAAFRFAFVNRTYERTTGKACAEVVGRSLWDVWPQLRSRELRFWDVYHRVMRQRLPEAFEEHLAALGGWLDVQVFPTREGGIAMFVRTIEERKQGEAALLRSEAMLRAILDQMPSGVVVREAGTGRLILTNARAGRILGPLAAHGLEFDRYGGVHPDDRPYHGEEWPLARALSSGEVVQQEEIECLQRDGRRFTICVNAAPVRDAVGQIVAAVSVVDDITDRRDSERLRARAEEALRESEARYRALFESMPDAVFMTVPEGRIVAANPAACTLFGRSEEEIVRVGRAGLIDPSDPRHFEAAEERRRTGFFRNRELTYLRADATPFTGETTSVLMPGDGHRAFVIVRDITDRKRAEQALRDSEQRWRQLADRMPQIVWAARADGTVDYFNRRWDELTGAGACPGGPAGWPSVLHPEDRQRTIDAWAAAVRAGSPHEIEHRFRLPGETEYRWSLTRALPVRDDEGRITRWYGTSTDIHERKLLTEAVREADRRKTEFLAMLSHELRNPLSPIRNSIFLLSRSPAGTEQARRALAVIDRQSRQLTRLVDDLLDVTRIERGKIHLQRERVDLATLVARVVDDHREAFEKGGIRLEVDVGDQPILVNVDPGRIGQAIGNLLGNAAKFTPPGGAARVHVRQVGEREAEVTVSDTGEGIAPDVLPGIFQPFVQAERTIQRSLGGLGLGLALVKGLLELHGGSITASSAGPGRGATFVARLPVERRVHSRLALVPARAPGGRADRILLIEDDTDSATAMRDLLELNGHTVEISYSGPDGLAKARAFHPDVVICDIGLPGMDGLQVARVLRADPELRSAGLVALSGYAQPRDIEDARAAGFDVHLAKPPAPDTLEQSMSEAVSAALARPPSNEPAGPLDADRRWHGPA